MCKKIHIVIFFAVTLAVVSSQSYKNICGLQSSQKCSNKLREALQLNKDVMEKLADKELDDEAKAKLKKACM